MKSNLLLGMLLLFTIIFAGCTPSEDLSSEDGNKQPVVESDENSDEQNNIDESIDEDLSQESEDDIELGELI